MTGTLTDAIEILKRAQTMLQPVIDGYERQLAVHGADPKSAFWKNAERQTRRYQILSRLFEKPDRQGGVTIADFGCGYGAFFDFLKDRPVMTGSRYIGIDLSSMMVEQAKCRIDDPRAVFMRQTMLTQDVDYTFVCGTYNMLMSAEPDEWAAYVRASLLQLWSRTRKGLGFNMLSIAADERYPSLYYAEPKEFLDYCARTLSPLVSLSDDKPLPDWTIFVRRA